MLKVNKLPSLRAISIFVWQAFCFLVLPAPIYAQTDLSAGPDNLESCFRYYDYGSVRANLATEKTTYLPGETVKLQGTVVNENTFPLVDVVLYAHLKRVNAETFAENGHFLTARLTLVEDLSFLPGETKGIQAEFPLRSTYPNGAYQLQYFIFSKHGFHYGGRPFLEEDTAGYTSFTVTGGSEPLVYFDIDNLRVAGSSHAIREEIVEYDSGTISFEIGIVDKRSPKGEIPVKIAWYSFEETFPENLVRVEETTIDPAENVLKTSFSSPEAGAYVLLLETQQSQSSQFKYRFAIKGSKASKVRINDLGVTSFPVSSQDRAWVCFHSPTPNEAPETKITLAVLNNAQEVVDETTISGSFGPTVQAVSLPLTKLTSPTAFWLRTQVSPAGDLTRAETVEVYYGCEKFSTSFVSLDASYDVEKSGLLLKALDACGGSVSDGGYLEKIQITQDDQVQKELYNLFSIPERLDLAELSPGTYQAEVKSGEIQKTLSFTVPQKVSEAKGVGFAKPVVVLITALAFSLLLIGGSLGYLYWKRRS